MKRLLISAIAAVSLTAAVTPAMAQSYRGDDYRNGQRYDRSYERGYDRGNGWGNIDAREAELARRVDEGARRGDLAGWQARQFHHELSSLQWLEQRYRNGGDGYRYGREGGYGRGVADLDNRLDILSQKIDRAMRNDWDRRRY